MEPWHGAIEPVKAQTRRARKDQTEDLQEVKAAKKE